MNKKESLLLALVVSLVMFATIKCKAQTDAYIIRGYSYTVPLSNSFNVYFHFNNSNPTKVNQVNANIIVLYSGAFSATNYYSPSIPTTLHSAGDYHLGTITCKQAGYFQSDITIHLDWILNGQFQWEDSLSPDINVGTPPTTLTIQNTNNSMFVSFNGTSFYPYIIQSATNLTPPINWQSIATNSADSNGICVLLDTNINTAQKYYRSHN